MLLANTGVRQRLDAAGTAGRRIRPANEARPADLVRLAAAAGEWADLVGSTMSAWRSEPPSIGVFAVNGEGRRSLSEAYWNVTRVNFVALRTVVHGMP